MKWEITKTGHAAVSAEESLRFNTSIASTFAMSISEYWKSYEPKSITDLKFAKKETACKDCLWS